MHFPSTITLRLEYRGNTIFLCIIFFFNFLDLNNHLFLQAIPEHVMEEQPSTEMIREGSLSRSRLLDDTLVSIHQRSTHSEADKSKDLDKSKGKEEPTLSKSK